MTKLYSLHKSRRILHAAHAWLKKRGYTLSESVRRQLEETLQALEQEIFAKNKKEATFLAKKIEETSQEHFKKSFAQYLFEIIIAVLVALAIATVVRQMWFELYEIPTGSMRPSFKEQDRLTVTKTAFGLNVPLETAHFYFDPALVERAKVFIFSGANIPGLDENSKYFGIFPYTKRYIKRMIGKPGDTLYFYGGKIYGVDKNDNPIETLLNDPWMKKIEHIPFIAFEGEVKPVRGTNKVDFYHFDKPVGRLAFNRAGTETGQILVNGRWIAEHPFSDTSSKQISSYGDFYGMNNFAMARILSKSDLVDYTKFTPEEVGDADYYLQIKHSPNLTYPLPKLYRQGSYFGIMIPTFESVIPLDKKHLDAIMDQMYTSRFVIKDGRARRYSYDNSRFSAANPTFTGIPNGTYEFYHGKAEKVGFAGWESKLPADAPLNKRDPERIKELFNMGIEMLTTYEPDSSFQINYPHRYAYFRDGDFYLMGGVVMKKDDPTLVDFVSREKEREKKMTKSHPYKAFVDRGPPLKEGKIDIEYVKTFGIKVPDEHYMALGDNHAMSKDSRIFGFVPQNNLQGAPSFIIWPPGSRWGLPPQTPYPFMNLPRLIVWIVAGAVILIWYIVYRLRLSRRLYPK